MGSAAFNFLVISGISIYAVNEGNDERTKQEREEDGTPLGVKKVQDTGVFAITTIWSIIAYIWLYIVLLDSKVHDWEAYLTLGFFFALILMAYIADCLRRKTVKDREDNKYGHEHEVADGKTHPGPPSQVATMDVVSFYNTLVPLEAGHECKAED